jgi:hypothetical protein
LTWSTWESKSATLLKSLSAEHTKARSPNCAQAELIMASVSARDSTSMLPKPKKIGGAACLTYFERVAGGGASAILSA